MEARGARAGTLRIWRTTGYGSCGAYSVNTHRFAPRIGYYCTINRPLVELSVFFGGEAPLAAEPLARDATGSGFKLVNRGQRY